MLRHFGNLLEPVLADAEMQELSIYFHWPFCAALCPYCDFNSHLSDRVDTERWKAAFETEIVRAGRLLGGRRIISVFFGGGTPSMMAPELAGALLETVAKTWVVDSQVEITLEANPTSVEANKLSGFRAAGVNRVSLGLQSLVPEALVALGRRHSVNEGLAAYDAARKWFDRVSFDLIYARQDQTLEGWKTELKEALALGPDHLSLYQLTIEPETVFGRRLAAGKLGGLPDEDLSADLFELTQHLTEAEGLPAYEISNHARPGSESRHNLTYWRGGDWIGLGPGAVGRYWRHDRRYATETRLHPEAWLEAVEETGTGIAATTLVEPDDVITELMMMGLRLNEGLPLDRLRSQPSFQSKLININRLVGTGHLIIEDDRVSASRSGRPVLNAVLRELIAQPAE